MRIKFGMRLSSQCRASGRYGAGARGGDARWLSPEARTGAGFPRFALGWWFRYDVVVGKYPTKTLRRDS